MKQEIKEILEDASDGVLKKKNKEKVKEVLKASKNASKTLTKGYKWLNKVYADKRSVPLPLNDVEKFIKTGKIEEIK